MQWTLDTRDISTRIHSWHSLALSFPLAIKTPTLVDDVAPKRIHFSNAARRKMARITFGRK